MNGKENEKNNETGQLPAAWREFYVGDIPIRIYGEEQIAFEQWWRDEGMATKFVSEKHAAHAGWIAGWNAKRA